MIKQILIHGVLPLALLAGGVAGARGLVATMQTTEREPQPMADPLVAVAAVVPYDGAAILAGSGIVEAARTATLSPEVGGRVKYLSPSLVEGGRVLQGEKLLEVDGRTYKLTVKQQRAQVDQAKASLELEENASEAARREWQAVGELPPEDARRVALRKPQVDAAEATIESARQALQRAQLDVDRTVVRAPFNASVAAESVEIGDLVNPGSPVATLVGTDRFWARISLPVEELDLVDFPPRAGQDADAPPGSPVTVVQELSAGKTVVRKGHVLRLLEALDAQSRTAQVLVVIDDPLDPPAGELPLLRGAFVTATIEGRRLDGARVVPRRAVFEGNRVWVVDDEQRLRLRTLTIAVSDDERVVATAGVQPGERVVLTPLRTPTEGMRVRIESEGARQEPEHG